MSEFDKVDAVQTDHFTRNGFAGPASNIVRGQYTPAYTRVEGDYRPLRFDISDWKTADDADARGLPLAVLDGDDVRVEMWRRETDTPFAFKDVQHDLVFYVLGGSARLETDFGVLDLVPHDMVKLARSVAIRLRAVNDLRLMVAVSAQAQYLSLDNPAMLNLERDVDVPRPYDSPPEPGPHELILRHGRSYTSFFYDYDPLHMTSVSGAPAVQRFNLTNVHPLTVADIGGPPGRMMSDDTTRSMFYYLGARESRRPPVHHNADYDEIAVYCAGPGYFGDMTVPGTMVFIPKGVIHQGPEEDVPEGFIAWLLETRADLTVTSLGCAAAELTDTSRFGRHPSAHEGRQKG